MKRPTKSIVTFLLLGGILAAPMAVTAQSIQEDLTGLLAENGERYASPIFEGLGYALNSGVAEDASVHGRFGFDVGVRVMGAWVPDDRKQFVPGGEIEFMNTTYTLADNLAPQGGGDLVTPTAAGDGAGLVGVPAGDYRAALIAAGEDPDAAQWQVPFPAGQDLPAVPFVVLQGGVGLGFNTEVTVRAIPSVEVDSNVGDISAFGLGAKHAIDGWLPAVPVDIAVTAGFQNLSVGEYLDANTTTLGLLVGRGLGPLEVYATTEWVNPSADLEYTVENPDANPALPADGTVIAIDPDIDSEARFGVGVNVQFLVLNVSALYTLGDYDVASLKAGVSFR